MDIGYAIAVLANLRGPHPCLCSMDRANSNNASDTTARAALCKACPGQSPTLFFLRQTFGARLLLDIDDVAAATGVAPKTIRNKIPHEWPINAQFVQGRWRMHILAVAQAIDSGALDFYRRRRRGRPRKTESSPLNGSGTAHRHDASVTPATQNSSLASRRTTDATP